MNKKTKRQRVPVDVYSKISRLGNLFEVPNTKAFILREKLINGDFKAKKIKRKRKITWEVEFE